MGAALAVAVVLAEHPTAAGEGVLVELPGLLESRPSHGGSGQVLRCHERVGVFVTQAIARDLISWLRLLGCEDTLARAEPAESPSARTYAAAVARTALR